MTAPNPLAQAVMVAYCGWDPTTPVTETVLLDGNGSQLLTLPSLYVTAVSAVAITNADGSVDTPSIGFGASLICNVGWKINGELWRNDNYWPQGQQNVSVTYSGGYSGPPDDVVAVLDSLTTRMPQ